MSMMINGKRGMAFTQIVLLVTFSFAVAFIMGEYVGLVSANNHILKGFNIEPEGPRNPGGSSITQVPASSNTVVQTTKSAGVLDTFNTAGGGVTKEIFINDKTYTGVLKQIDGVDHVLVDGKNLAKWNGEGWDKVAGSFGTTTNPAYHSYKPFGIFPEIGGGSAFGGFTAHLAQGAVWSLVAYGAIQLLGSAFGLEEGLTNSLSYAAVGGIMTYQGILSLGPTGLGTLLPNSAILAGAFPIALGVGAAIFLVTYKKQKQELVKFECLPWEPPTGGQNCEKCNEGELPCSEYRCKSLGQACEIVNPGTEEESCVWINKGDTAAPIITVWEDALSPDGLNYVPDNAISPPNKGFKLLQKPQGCLDPFTKLEFGILTNEPAQCKIDYDGLTKTHDEMGFFFGEQSLYVEEHTQRLKVPSPFSEEGDNAGIPEIHNDGTYTLAVKCRDANGNENTAAVAFSFCVQEGPDVTQPVIEGTSIESGKPVTFQIDEVPIEVYVNEPAECRWSHQDKSYDAMENEMSCATESFQINAELNYVCTGTLNEIKDREDNDFYFRCKDFSKAPGGRNEMTSSYKLTLKGTEELAILSVGPEGEFEGSTSTVEVNLTAETGFGANNGKAICYLSATPEIATSFFAIDTDFKIYHGQSLFLPAGEHTYFFRCIDAGGNSAEDGVTFTVIVDDDIPQIVRVFRDGSGLKIITDEVAECAYSLTSCNYNFEDGLPLVYDDAVKKTTHLTEWDSTVTYHIKCRDLNGNQPAGNECSIIAQGSEL
jgi:hypothetical protein